MFKIHVYLLNGFLSSVVFKFKLVERTFKHFTGKRKNTV